MRHAASHRIILAPLQGAAESRCLRVMNPGHRFAQPWARVFRPVGPMNFVPNGDRDSSPGLRELWRLMSWETNALPVFISSRPEGAREAFIHP